MAETHPPADANQTRIAAIGEALLFANKASARSALAQPEFQFIRR